MVLENLSSFSSKHSFVLATIQMICTHMRYHTSQDSCPIFLNGETFWDFFFFFGKYLAINDLSDFMLSIAFNMACLCYLCMEWLIICDYWEPNHWQMKNIIKTSTFEMILVEIKATLSKRESCVDLSKI